MKYIIKKSAKESSFHLEMWYVFGLDRSAIYVRAFNTYTEARAFYVHYPNFNQFRYRYTPKEFGRGYTVLFSKSVSYEKFYEALK